MSAEAPSSLVFAIVSGLPDAQALLDRFCEALGEGLDLPVVGKVLASHAALEQEMEAGRADVVWAPPRVGIDLEDAGLGTIELCCTHGGGHTDYHSALFTRHAAPYEKIADLANTNAVWVDRKSSAGYILPRMKIRAEGFRPSQLFRKQTFLGTHAAVAHAVLAGEADVGATYLHLDRKTGRPVSAGWLDAGAGINGAFIIAQAGPIPSDAIVMGARVAAERRKQLAERFLAAPAAVPDALGRLLGADGFAPAERRHFDALRALLAARK